ncbi:MAG TPA: LysR family transcriptional regulator [Lichenihabitans sp.]|nr:LysR family transcriptional regulator [Lichenihabitans sp.]
MDRLEAMSILIAAVEAGSFSAASRKLGTPLPTISRKVADLEAHLNTRLLVRSTRKLALTDSGTAYLAACRRILEQVSEAEAEASGEYDVPRGELILSAPIVFGRLHVVPVINDFLANYPEINVRLVLTDRNVHLLDDHIDMAARIGPLRDSRMIATRIGSVRRVVCGSPGYFSSHGVPATPDDLSDLTCVTVSGLSSGPSWTFSTPGRGPVQATPPRCRLNVNTAEAAIDSAIAGVGVTRVLSYQVARAVTEGQLLVVLDDFETEAIPVHLLHAGQGLLPLKTRRFLDFAVPRLRRALAGEADRSREPIGEGP